MEESWFFFPSLVKNGEIKPSHSYKIILEQREVKKSTQFLKGSVPAHFGNKNAKT